MRCPFCGGLDNKVIDSRLSQGDEVIRRRRECEGCDRRFTTYERLELVLPMVVKKDGRREPFAGSAERRAACAERRITEGSRRRNRSRRDFAYGSQSPRTALLSAKPAGCAASLITNCR